ncbi:hypothetical protein HK101_006936, partial [Irineochytrium annulatum]
MGGVGGPGLRRGGAMGLGGSTYPPVRRGGMQLTNARPLTVPAASAAAVSGASTSTTAAPTAPTSPVPGTGEPAPGNDSSPTILLSSVPAPSMMSRPPPFQLQQNQQQQQRQCRFGANCTRADCAFSHPSPAALMAAGMIGGPQSSMMSRGMGGRMMVGGPQRQHVAVQCKFWPRCANPNCAFIHPSGNGAAAGPAGAAGGPAGPMKNVSSVDMSKVPCKFEPFCGKAGCPFLHGPPVEIMSKTRPEMAEKKKPGVGPGHHSERSFAVPDEEVAEEVKTEEVAAKVEAEKVAGDSGQ